MTATRGFSLTHLSGVGCGVYGDVPILPILGIPSLPPPVRPAYYIANFSHANEIAQPGYYAVKLDNGIEVELAADVRSGIATISYPAGGGAHTLLVDLSRNLAHVYGAQIHIAQHDVSGSVSGGGFCNLANRYCVYFFMKIEEPYHSAGTFDEVHVAPDKHDASGTHIGGYLAFDDSIRSIHFKVGISYVSVANARLNLEREIPGWDFDGTRVSARAAWNEALGHIAVSGGTQAQQATLYTALYHSLLHPTVFSDVNGQYLGFDSKVHVVQGRTQYANYSGWDIYRTQVQLIAMLMPNVAGDMAQSLVSDAEQGGGLPIWPVANEESSCMVGDPSDEILADVYAFGVRNFDSHAALRAMLRGASDPGAHIGLYAERPGLRAYLQRGYVPNSDPVDGGASVTLENESADFAIAQMAAALGESTTAQKYLKRAAQWRKLFDPKTRYIRARGADGEFLPNFKPAQLDGYVEGNAAQYTWMVPWDLKGLISDIGGPEAVRTRLDDYFSQYTSWNGGPYFFIGNEPSFGDPWIYNWTGYPWRAQEVVRKTLSDVFQPAPDGEPGNDDLGAMSAWIVFANLGLYPEIPGVGGFTLSSPVFPTVELKLGSHRLSISAPGAPGQRYIKTVSVDGATVNNWWVDWTSLAAAREVQFTLAPQPSGDPGFSPPSFDGGDGGALSADGSR